MTILDFLINGTITGQEIFWITFPKIRSSVSMYMISWHFLCCTLTANTLFFHLEAEKPVIRRVLWQNFQVMSYRNWARSGLHIPTWCCIQAAKWWHRTKSLRMKWRDLSTIWMRCMSLSRHCHSWIMIMKDLNGSSLWNMKKMSWHSFAKQKILKKHFLRYVILLQFHMRIIRWVFHSTENTKRSSTVTAKNMADRE